MPNILWQERPKLPKGPPLQKMLSPELAADIAGARSERSALDCRSRWLCRGRERLGAGEWQVDARQGEAYLSQRVSWRRASALQCQRRLALVGSHAWGQLRGQEQATLICPWQFQELLRPAPAAVVQQDRIGVRCRDREKLGRHHGLPRGPVNGMTHLIPKWRALKVRRVRKVTQGLGSKTV